MRQGIFATVRIDFMTHYKPSYTAGAGLESCMLLFPIHAMPTIERDALPLNGHTTYWAGTSRCTRLDSHHRLQSSFLQLRFGICVSKRSQKGKEPRKCSHSKCQSCEIYFTNCANIKCQTLLLQDA